MASPQLEHGHSRLANEILEAIIKCPPATVTARQLWDWIWRNSWGRRGAMNTRPTSIRDLAEQLDMSRGAAARALESLLVTNHAIRNVDGSLSIQKDHEVWIKDERYTRRPPPSKQMMLLAETAVPRAGTKCPIARDKVSHRTGQNRPIARDKIVPSDGTPHIRSLKKERKKESTAQSATPQISKAMNDTPRTRAEAGDPNMPPEEHPDFGKLGFKRRDELTDLWKERCAKRLCKKACGRPKASESWPYCRPCTACSKCQGKADGRRSFSIVNHQIVCADCNTEPARKT